MTLRVAALTSGLHTPSSRFRIRQHIAPLVKHGIEVREFKPFVEESVDNVLLPLRPEGVRIRQMPPLYPVYGALLALRVAARMPGVAASWHSDVTWLERGLCAGWPTLEKQLRKPLVLDVDDAVWLAEPLGGTQMRRAAERADVVVVCNSYLADWFGQYCTRIEMVPTAVDAEVFVPAPKKERSPYIVGWTGVRANYRYVEAIRPALARFLAHAPDARLRIVADAPPPHWDLPADSVEFIQWSEQNEIASVQSMDVGIMPLLDTEWTRGKCGFKAIQYMACGVPVIASPVGMNVELLQRGVGLAASTEQQWLDALIFLYEHSEDARRIGALGRTIFLERYSLAAATSQLARIFKSLR